MCFLRAYVSLHKFNVVRISETHLDSNTAFDNDNLEITKYNLLSANHASNDKRGGVSVYYEKKLALKLIDVYYLRGCLVFEILIERKLCNSISLYRSPSQSLDSFEKFSDNYR